MKKNVIFLNFRVKNSNFYFYIHERIRIQDDRLTVNSFLRSIILYYFERKKQSNFQISFTHVITNHVSISKKYRIIWRSYIFLFENMRTDRFKIKSKII